MGTDYLVPKVLSDRLETAVLDEPRALSTEGKDAAVKARREKPKHNHFLTSE